MSFNCRARDTYKQITREDRDEGAELLGLVDIWGGGGGLPGQAESDDAYEGSMEACVYLRYVD